MPDNLASSKKIRSGSTILISARQLHLFTFFLRKKLCSFEPSSFTKILDNFVQAGEAALWDLEDCDSVEDGVFCTKEDLTCNETDRQSPAFIPNINKARKYII